jgi:dynein heavy chain 2
MNPQIQGLISELEKNLLNSLDKSSGIKSLILESVTSVSEEFNYWNRLATSSSSTKLDRERALFFQNELAVIKGDYEDVKNIEIADIIDLVEKTKDVLDSIWRQEDHNPYPQNRMYSLIVIVVELILNDLMLKVGPNILTEPSGVV